MAREVFWFQRGARWVVRPGTTEVAGEKFWSGINLHFFSGELVFKLCLKLFLFVAATTLSLVLACEQAPKWGIGRKEKSANRASRARCFSPLLSELDFCPHLGACSQASLVLICREKSQTIGDFAVSRPSQTYENTKSQATPIVWNGWGINPENWDHFYFLAVSEIFTIFGDYS